MTATWGSSTRSGTAIRARDSQTHENLLSAGTLASALDVTREAGQRQADAGRSWSWLGRAAIGWLPFVHAFRTSARLLRLKYLAFSPTSRPEAEGDSEDCPAEPHSRASKPGGVEQERPVRAAMCVRGDPFQPAAIRSSVLHRLTRLAAQEQSDSVVERRFAEGRRAMDQWTVVDRSRAVRPSQRRRYRAVGRAGYRLRGLRRGRGQNRGDQHAAERRDPPPA